MKTRIMTALIGVLATASAVPAAIITANTPGDGVIVPVDIFFGQSVTTPNGGPWNNLRVNFYSDEAMTTPLAVGDLFLFSMQFTGLNDELSGVTALSPEEQAAIGFLAKSTGVVANMWQFDSSVVLTADTQYFFYATTPMAAAVNLSDSYAAGMAHLQNDVGEEFVDNPSLDVGFTLQTGSQAVAEPASLTIAMVLGAAGAAATSVRRRKPRACPAR